ncbi:carbohydrate ABC transporter permease [Cohnella sp. 56]|uniref:carbohydrate ABC transporter permease n=1 Tax=Cohnella sp. 56 TaxID=3113722 RepID=UPI0030EA9302
MFKRIVSGNKMFTAVAYVLTAVWCALLLVPLLFLFSSSMKDDLQIYEAPPKFLPSPPKSIGIVLDYTQVAAQGEAALKEALWQDSTLALYSTVYEINKSGVFQVDFYGTVGDRVIYKSSSGKSDLQMNMTYLIYDKAQVNRANLLEKYKQSVDQVGYRFDPQGLSASFDRSRLGDNELSGQIGDYLTDKYKVEGVYKGSIVRESYWFALKNFAGYWKLPKVLFAKDEMIARFSFLWFGANTLLVIAFAIAAQVTIDSLAAFALSRLFGRRMAKLLLLYILAATMIPFVAYMIPMYVMFQRWGLSDSYWGMLVPHLTAAGFFVYLYKGFFDKLPGELFEAARVDGASEMRVYFSILMRLSQPVTAVVAITTMLGVWNDFFWPFLIVKKAELWPLNVALYNLSLNANIKQNFLMGMAALSLIPLLIVVTVFSDNLRKGMVFSGIKG